MKGVPVDEAGSPPGVGADRGPIAGATLVGGALDVRGARQGLPTLLHHGAMVHH